MKKAEEILDNGLSLLKPNSFIQIFYKINREKVLNIIRQIQEDAIRETVQECTNSAKTFTDYIFDGKLVTVVDKNSILSIADKLIKEL